MTISFRRARRSSFFRSVLSFSICLGHDRPWLASSESQLMEKPSTLTFTQPYIILFRQMMTEKLTIPEILRISKLPRRAAQISSNPVTNVSIDKRRTAGSRCLLKTCKATFFKSPDPVLNSPWPVAKKFSHLRATDPRANKQNAVEPVIVSRLLRSQNLLLQSNSHDFCICNLKLAHPTTPFLPYIR